MYCIHKSMHGEKITPPPPPPKCGKSGDNTAPTRGRPLRCTAQWPRLSGCKSVESGPAWRVLDDELEQLDRRIGQASSGFDEEDSEVIRVRGEVPEDGSIPRLFSRGPDLLDPRDASSWEDNAVDVEFANIIEKNIHVKIALEVELICKHNKQKSRCKECAGNGRCQEHNRIKNRCKDCSFQTIGVWK